MTSAEMGTERVHEVGTVKRRRSKRIVTDAFDIVRTIGLTMPDVEAGVKYDGSPVLKAGGAFMAGLALDRSTEPDTLVVRVGFEEREGLLEDAPDVYYLTEYHKRHPVVLVRLRRVDTDALHDLLAIARRRTLLKSRRSGG
jgi:hypothetical protein